MKKYVYEGAYYEVETTVGTEVVPDCLVNRLVSLPASYLGVYLEGEPLDPYEIVDPIPGWYGRWSLPGFLDCTAWCGAPTLAELERQLAIYEGD